MKRFILYTALLFSLAAARAQEGISAPGGDTLYAQGMIQGDTVEAVFHFSNAGKQKFLIWQVHPACQCTAPVYPKDSILPGQHDSIVLVFYSKHILPGDFDKSAIVLNAHGERNFHVVGNLGFNTGQRQTRKWRVSNGVK